MKHQRSSGRVAITVAMTLAMTTFAFSAARATPASGFTAAQQWKGVYGALDVNAVKVDSWISK